MVSVPDGDVRAQRRGSQTITTRFVGHWPVFDEITQRWKQGWPEIISACWITFILLSLVIGICLATFYIMGLISYSHPLFVVKCNNSSSVSDVYIHQLVPYGNYVPFMVYSRFLAYLGMHHPLLRFNVFFLIDDSVPHMLQPKRAVLYQKFMPYTSKLPEAFNKRGMNLFQKRYPNMNITVMLLSQYMATTPLRYKWRNIQSSYLPFYARIHSVWENGGIGLDLARFNSIYNKYGYDSLNHRSTAVLKLHNEGLGGDGYADIFESVHEHYDDFNLISPIYDFIGRLINESRLFFNCNDTLFNSNLETNNAVTESVSKINITDREGGNNNDSHLLVNNTTKNASTDYSYTTVIDKVYIINAENRTKRDGGDKSTLYEIYKQPKAASNSTVNEDKSVHVNNSANSTQTNIFNSTVLGKKLRPQIFFIYDISVVNEVPDKESSELGLKEFGTPPLSLSISSDGAFVSATDKQHPMLGDIIAIACKRMYPRFAIQEALNSQCFAGFKEDLCDNIYVF